MNPATPDLRKMKEWLRRDYSNFYEAQDFYEVLIWAK